VKTATFILACGTKKALSVKENEEGFGLLRLDFVIQQQDQLVGTFPVAESFGPEFAFPMQ
jgi:hypothetical protein